MGLDFLKMTIARMAEVPRICIRCGAHLDLDDEEYEKCPSLDCQCEDGSLSAEDALDRLGERPAVGEEQTNYIADGGERSWDRESCAPEGFKMLVDWAVRNETAIESVSVRYNPSKVEPDPVEAWTAEPVAPHFCEACGKLTHVGQACKHCAG